MDDEDIVISDVDQPDCVPVTHEDMARGYLDPEWVVVCRGKSQRKSVQDGATRTLATCLFSLRCKISWRSGDVCAVFTGADHLYGMLKACIPALGAAEVAKRRVADIAQLRQLPQNCILTCEFSSDIFLLFTPTHPNDEFDVDDIDDYDMGRDDDAAAGEQEEESVEVTLTVLDVTTHRRRWKRVTNTGLRENHLFVVIVGGAGAPP
jgi:hypothetical protein